MTKKNVQLDRSKLLGFRLTGEAAGSKLGAKVGEKVGEKAITNAG